MPKGTKEPTLTISVRTAPECARPTPGDLAEITPVSGETPVHGEVVYCQKLDNDRFFVGFKVRVSRILWSILLRFDGIDMMEFGDTDTVKCKFCGSDEQKRLRAEIAIHVPDIN